MALGWGVMAVIWTKWQRINSQMVCLPRILRKKWSQVSQRTPIRLSDMKQNYKIWISTNAFTFPKDFAMHAFYKAHAYFWCFSILVHCWLGFQVQWLTCSHKIGSTYNKASNSKAKVKLRKKWHYKSKFGHNIPLSDIHCNHH